MEHHPLPSTIMTLNSHYRKAGSWRATAEALGYPAFSAATLSGVAMGKPGSISLSGENILRVRMRLEPRGTYEHPACPDCGGDHAPARCHGQEVIETICVTPGMRVRKPAPAWVQWAAQMLREMEARHDST